MKILKYFFALSNIIFFISFQLSYPQDCSKPTILGKQLGSPSRVKLNINNISTWFNNSGISDINSLTYQSGFEFPKGSGKTAVFQSGLLWGANTNAGIKVGGTQYRTGLQPGRILPDGTAESSTAAQVRIFRVRPDYKTNPLNSELNEKEGTIDQIRASYEKDWNEWPAIYGAPFEDKNMNGKYEPDIDIPGHPGAHQTIWYIANDLDPELTASLAGSTPMGLEVQTTVWGYNSTYNYLRNTLFRKYKIINKSNSNFSNMYVDMWSDPELGPTPEMFAGDLCGSDSLLNLGFDYYSNNINAQYGNNPPAVGIMLLQGPMVSGNSGDQAIFNGKKVPGKKNLAMTAFFHFYCGGPGYQCPAQGEYVNGTLAWYNYFQGIEGNTNKPFQLPIQLGGTITKFTLNGDPLTGQGWIDGVYRNAGDRYINIVSGPFNLAAGDTQEVVFAELAAEGTDRLDAVKVLKGYSTGIAYDYRDSLYRKVSIPVGIKKEEKLPTKFVLYQNYPNPFNPATVINYQLPINSYVTLKVYDLLGREVATLVDEFQYAGFYNSQFSIENFKLSSGVYFYKLRAGDCIGTKKLVLMK